MTVFVPSTGLLARAWRDGGFPPRLVGYAATGAMLAAHGLEPGAEEEGDFTALNYAATAALTLSTPDDPRVVLALGVAARNTVLREMSAEVAAEVGAVVVDDARWRNVKALFVDEAGAAGAVATARQVIGEHSWVDVWEDPDVQELVTGFDVLWYVPDELDTLIEEGSN